MNLHLVKHMVEPRKPRAMPSLPDPSFHQLLAPPPCLPTAEPSVPEVPVTGDNMSPRWGGGGVEGGASGAACCCCCSINNNLIRLFTHWMWKSSDGGDEGGGGGGGGRWGGTKWCSETICPTLRDLITAKDKIATSHFGKSYALFEKVFFLWRNW